MLMNIIVLLNMIYLVGIYSFFMKSNHLLNMLLSLEFFVLITFINMFCMFWEMNDKFILVYFLVFCVCEGAFGISILVSLVRSFGNDYLQSIMFVKC
uniref:NADH-ubiquinone oxidoreductase chain 4L n=1 Tax=Fuelleborniella sp. FuspCA TaxID=2597024 RepID=A0A8K1ZFG5_9NEOP|nr:NADH dehydrogenase subunit 4L [Fuelleborniella sp. FuspCA]